MLRFNAYFKQTVHESQNEYFRVRPVDIYYYLEDDSIAVIEPHVENCGMPQGKNAHELLCDKSSMICACSEDSDQPRHLPSLSRVFNVHMNKAKALSYLLSAQQRLIRLGGCPD